MSPCHPRMRVVKKPWRLGHGHARGPGRFFSHLVCKCAIVHTYILGQPTDRGAVLTAYPLLLAPPLSPSPPPSCRHQTLRVPEGRQGGDFPPTATTVPPTDRHPHQALDVMYRALCPALFGFPSPFRVPGEGSGIRPSRYSGHCRRACCCCCPARPHGPTVRRTRRLTHNLTREHARSQRGHSTVTARSQRGHSAVTARSQHSIEILRYTCGQAYERSEQTADPRHTRHTRGDWRRHRREGRACVCAGECVCVCVCGV